MHTLDMLERAIAAVEKLGYRVRQEWLGGDGGGGCEIRGQKWLFLDLAQNPADQLEVVADVLRREAAATATSSGDVSDPRSRMRKSA